MRVKCPKCGHIGSEDTPMRSFERWAEDEYCGFRVHNEAAELVAEGFDPERTGVLWFLCGGCEHRFPSYWWRKESPDDLHWAFVHDDRDEVYDPTGYRDAWWAPLPEVIET
jgi:hypothetical protein